ncbi:MAG: hypothetical protein RSC76_02860 [Oscillospiraceae bacterium]
MKIFVSLLLSAMLTLSLAGCAFAPPAASSTPSAVESAVPSKAESAAESKSPESKSPESAPSQSEESSAASAPANPEKAPEESKALPAVSGSADFVKAFGENPVDSVYLADIQKAMDQMTMIQVTNTAASSWETQINSVFSKLTDSLSGDALDKITLEQSAWSNELEISVQEIQDAAAGKGSAANVEIAYNVMLLYRTRAAILFEKQFELDGKVTFSARSGDAKG